MYKITVPTIISYAHFDEEGIIAELHRSGAHRAALAIYRELSHAFSSPETLSRLRHLILRLKAEGMETLVWLGETFGHHGTKETEESPYQNIHSFTKGRTKPFCPLDENFQRDFCNWVRQIAECGADMILLDDDYRTDVRGDNALGCCCPLHLKEMEKLLGEPVKADTLWQKMLTGGRNRYREAWIEVQRESMLTFSKKLRAAVDEIDPEIRMGYCACIGWDTTGCEMESIARALAGNTRPIVRLSGAPYWHRPLAECIELERFQLSWLKDKGIELITEGDTYPRPRFVTSAAKLECFDMALRADGNSDGILKYMLDYVSSARYERGYVDAHLENAALYKEIEETFANKQAVGMRLYNFPCLFPDREMRPTEEMMADALGESYYGSIKLATYCSLPTCCEGEGIGIITGENARQMPLEQLRGGLLDLPAAKILTERGVDVGIESITPFALPSQAGFGDLPVEYFPEEDEYVRLELGVPLFTVEKKKGTRPLSFLEVGGVQQEHVFAYENAEGQRFVILPFDLRTAAKKSGWLTSYTRRRQIVDALAWLGAPLAAYLEGNHPYHYSIVKEDERELAVGIWNFFEDPIKDPCIRLSFTPKSVSFINCTGRIEGNGVYLANKIYPFEFAGITVTKK